MAKYVKDNVVQGIVTGIEKYGIFVSCGEYYSGLVHISEISHKFVKDIHNFVKVGETIYVKILDIDEKNYHLTLSIKDIHYKVKPTKNAQKIVETKHGFRTLAYKLPFWIDRSIKKIENNKKI